MTGRTGRASGDADGPSSKSASTGGKNLNDTIDCLLNLRSVRDQFKDAELDLSNDKVAQHYRIRSSRLGGVSSNDKVAQVAQQLRDLEDRLVDHLAEERELRDGVGLLTVAVVGDFNSGKSTFINALIGTDLCPVGDEPTTASVTHFIHGDKQRFELERDGMRTSIERGKYLSMVRHSKVGDREAYVFHVSMDSPVLEHIRMVDTPGFNAPPPNTNDTRVTEDAVATADALFVITDACKGNPSKTLLEQLDRLRNTRQTESGPPAFLLLNKSESMPPSKRRELKRVCEKQYDDRFCSVTSVSASRLNDTGDTAPLDALETTMRRIRDALSRRESFDATISAKAVTERGQPTYRVEIDRNVYQANVSPDGDLASRDQLAEMVRDVAAKRHALFETRFRRRKSQLREDWMKVMANLDRLSKRAAMASFGAGQASAERGNVALTLMNINYAKDQILNRVRAVLHEATAAALYNGQWKTSRFLSRPTVYHVDVCPDKAHGVVAGHEEWDRITVVVNNLIDSLKRVTDVGTDPDLKAIPDELREYGVGMVHSWSEDTQKSLKKKGVWRGAKRRSVFEDDRDSRNQESEKVKSILESEASRLTLDFSRSVLQPKIDKLQEAIIRYGEQGQAAVREREDELTRLRERIDELKKYTPWST